MAKDIELGFGQKNEEGQIEQIGTINLRVPESWEEAKQMWGEEVCLSNLIAAIKVRAQAICRAAESPEKAQEVMNTWQPGVSREREGGASLANLAKKIKGLSEEKRNALLAELGLI